MSREQERAKRKLEKNPIVECNKIQNKFYPELFKKFSEVKDPRNQSYIDYSVKTMLGTLPHGVTENHLMMPECLISGKSS